MNLNIQQLEIIIIKIGLTSKISDEWLSWKHAVKYVNHKYGKCKNVYGIEIEKH